MDRKRSNGACGELVMDRSDNYAPSNCDFGPKLICVTEMATQYHPDQSHSPQPWDPQRRIPRVANVKRSARMLRAAIWNLSRQKLACFRHQK